MHKCGINGEFKLLYLCVYIRFKQQEMNLYIGTLQAQESPEPTIDLSKCELEEV